MFLLARKLFIEEKYGKVLGVSESEDISRHKFLVDLMEGDTYKYFFAQVETVRFEMYKVYEMLACTLI